MSKKELSIKWMALKRLKWLTEEPYQNWTMVSNTNDTNNTNNTNNTSWVNWVNW